tara:strand:- start:201 stop:347 length:147 start_codon:yes stop_codon:yes gene_type:complete
VQKDIYERKNRMKKKNMMTMMKKTRSRGKTKKHLQSTSTKKRKGKQER